MQEKKIVVEVAGAASDKFDLCNEKTAPPTLDANRYLLPYN